MLHIISLICNMLMESGNLNTGLIPVGTTLCFSG